jgi:hypothetical protein
MLRAAVAEILTPARFTMSLGNGLDGYYIVEADNKTLVWEFQRGGDAEKHAIVPTREDWSSFWQVLNQLDIWSWDARYETKGVLDGTHWRLAAQCAGRTVESSGSNGYPAGQGPDPSELFMKLCEAISRVSGREFG